jgi:hypothetical protein
VGDACDVDLGDRGSLDAREKNATKTVSDGRTKASFKGLGNETSEGVRSEFGLIFDSSGELEASPAYMHD